MWTPSDALLARYVAGNCAAADVHEIERWASQDPAHRARVDELRALWTARKPVPVWDADAIWTNVRGTMRAVRPRLARWPWISAAAAVVELVGGALIVFFSRSDTPTTLPGAAPMREYVTGRGQRATLQLPDGTRLALAPGSRLRLSSTFGQSAREVFLEGEALFEVVHDTTRPFRVLAKDAVAEDLGTTFDVRAYPEDSVVAVAVAEGVVALGRGGAGEGAPQGILLRPGELGKLGPTGRVETARGAALAAYLDWVDGRLTFADTPLRDASLRLGRWYNVDVQLDAPDLEQRLLTVTLLNESAAEALQFVATVLGLDLVRERDRYILRHP
jgi:transmembrane sensor